MIEENQDGSWKRSPKMKTKEQQTVRVRAELLQRSERQKQAKPALVCRAVNETGRLRGDLSSSVSLARTNGCASPVLFVDFAVFMELHGDPCLFFF